MPLGLERLTSDLEQLRQAIQTRQIKDIEIIDDQRIRQNPYFKIYAISGPLDSPYEGYWFRIEMDFSHDYPFKAPQVKMLDKVWSPYFDFNSGDICLDILDDQWTPAYTPTKTLLSIISVLSQTKINLEGPGFLNPQAASEMKNNYDHFKQEVKKHSALHSYRRQQIYNDSERAAPQQPEIIAQGVELVNRIREDIRNDRLKKKKEIKKLEPLDRSRARNRRRRVRRIRRLP